MVFDRIVWYLNWLFADFRTLVCTLIFLLFLEITLSVANRHNYYWKEVKLWRCKYDLRDCLQISHLILNEFKQTN